MPAPDYAEEIAALERGMASGEAEIVGPDGRRTRYRSPTEIAQALLYFRAQAQAARAGADRTTYVTFGRD